MESCAELLISPHDKRRSRIVGNGKPALQRAEAVQDAYLA
jgi:hypothetical protein